MVFQRPWGTLAGAFARAAPTPEGSHIGPGLGLVDEDQPLSFDAILILCPPGAPPRHVGTIAFVSHHAFFEAELLGVHEVPHRVVVDLQAASGKLGNQPRNAKSPLLIRCDSKTAWSPETAFGL